MRKINLSLPISTFPVRSFCVHLFFGYDPPLGDWKRRDRPGHAVFSILAIKSSYDA